MAKMSLPVQMDPKFIGTIDSSETFATLEDAETFVASDVRCYPGKMILVSETSKRYQVNATNDGLVELGTGSGGSGGGDAVLESDLTFTKQVGGITPGTSFDAGTPHESVLKAMARTAAVYTSPTLTLAYSVPANSEVGTNVNLTAVPTWTQNDAGTATAYELRKSGTPIHNSAAPENYAVPPWTLTETAVTFQASVSYDEGPVKQDSAGNDDPTGQIPAATLNSNTISVVGVRYLFWGKTSSDPSTSAHVRALPNIVKNPNSSTQFNIVTGTLAAGEKITIWYPAFINDLESVSYVEGGNANYTDLFVSQSQIAVEGVNGYSAIAYKGFTLTAAAAVSSSMTLTVKL